jgi:hypothetical protein
VVKEMVQRSKESGAYYLVKVITAGDKNYVDLLGPYNSDKTVENVKADLKKEYPDENDIYLTMFIRSPEDVLVF